MKELTTKQRAFLRSLAHELKPSLHVGKDGVTDAAAEAVRGLFVSRELLKIKILATAPESANDSAEDLARRVGAQLIQVIGRTAVLYREHPEFALIRLPRAKQTT